MKSKKNFCIGDKVFAKVKGYPPWPAIIDEIKRKRYSVTFYGTKKTSKLKLEDLCDYIDNRDKFTGKYSKRKGFLDSILELEEELSGTNTAIDEELYQDNGAANLDDVSESFNDDGENQNDDTPIISSQKRKKRSLSVQSEEDLPAAKRQFIGSRKSSIASNASSRKRMDSPENQSQYFDSSLKNDEDHMRNNRTSPSESKVNKTVSERDYEIIFADELYEKTSNIFELMEKAKSAEDNFIYNRDKFTGKYSKRKGFLDSILESEEELSGTNTAIDEELYQDNGAANSDDVSESFNDDGENQNDDTPIISSQKRKKRSLSVQSEEDLPAAKRQFIGSRKSSIASNASSRKRMDSPENQSQYFDSSLKNDEDHMRNNRTSPSESKVNKTVSERDYEIIFADELYEKTSNIFELMEKAKSAEDNFIYNRDKFTGKYSKRKGFLDSILESEEELSGTNTAIDEELYQDNGAANLDDVSESFNDDGENQNDDTPIISSQKRKKRSLSGQSEEDLPAAKRQFIGSRKSSIASNASSRKRMDSPENQSQYFDSSLKNDEDHMRNNRTSPSESKVNKTVSERDYEIILSRLELYEKTSNIFELMEKAKSAEERHISQENININKKRKNENSDKSSSSKTKITTGDKITNDLNEPQQLADLNSKANHNDYKIQQSDSNQLEKKIDTQIEKHGESSNKNVPETIVEKKIDPEIPIIDLTIPEFTKKEEPLEDDIIEVQDVPMLRVEENVFLSKEATNIIEEIKTSMSFTCTDVRTCKERICILRNRMDKTREEVLKTEQIESRALAIQPILANNLHYFNDTNMFKALTQSINDLSNEKFTIDYVEHVFQLLVSQSPLLRKEFHICTNNNESSNNRPSPASIQVSESNIHNSIVSSSYNTPTDLIMQQLHNNNSISNQTYSNIPNNSTMANSNTIGSSDGQESNYLINSSVPPQSNGYYNPQSAQMNDSYQVRPTNIPLAINSAKNNNIINSPTSQILNNLSPAYNNPNALQHLTQTVRNPNENDNYYTVNNTYYNNYLAQKRIENTQKYNTDMYTSMNSPYANNEQQKRQNPQAHSQLPLQAYQMQTEQYGQQKRQETLYQQQLNNRQVIQNYQRQAQVQYQSGQHNQQSLTPNQPHTGNQQQPGNQQLLQQSKFVQQTQLKSIAEKPQPQLQQINQNHQELQKSQTYLTMPETFQRQQIPKEIIITEQLNQHKQQHFHNQMETETGRTSSIAVGNSINRDNFVNSYYLKPMSNKNINGEENLSMPNSRAANNVQDVASSMPNSLTVIANDTVYQLALMDSRATNVPGQSIATTVPTSTFSYAQPVSNHIRTTDANSNSL